MTRSVWTESENNVIVEARAQGLTYLEIRKLLPHRTHRAIAVQGAKLGNGITYEFWTDNQLCDLMDMRSEGLSYEIISRHIGRSHQSVKHKGAQLIREGLLDKGIVAVRNTDNTRVNLIVYADLTPEEIQYIETGVK